MNDRRRKMILFVCNGNIERSVVAEKYFIRVLEKAGLDGIFLVFSCGLQGTRGTTKPLHRNLKEYSKEWAAALPGLRQFDIAEAVAGHISRVITPAIVKKATVIIAMDDKTYSVAENFLLRQFPEAKHKIHSFSELTPDHEEVKDPAGIGNRRVHQSLIAAICSALEDNFEIILNWVKSGAEN
jgi:protein-tyrosine-phosphatase